MPGLRWEIGSLQPKDPSHSQKHIIEALAKSIEPYKSDSMAFMLDNRRYDAAYEDLKMRGHRRSPTLKNLIAVLEGSHGYDSKDDKNSTFFDNEFSMLKATCGPECAST